MDKIIIKGLRLFARHGLREQEKKNGQVFVLDVTLSVSLAEAGKTDDIASTVNYSQVTKAITQVFCEQRFDLIERAAQAVAETVLARFAPVEAVTVLLKKPEAPVAADFDYMAVEITRTRGDIE